MKNQEDINYITNLLMSYSINICQIMKNIEQIWKYMHDRGRAQIIIMIPIIYQYTYTTFGSYAELPLEWTWPIGADVGWQASIRADRALGPIGPV